MTSYTGDLRTLFEIRNSKNANELFLQSFHQKRPLDESLVREFKECLTQNTYDTRRYQLGERPGEYKHHDYVTGKNEIGAAQEDRKEYYSALEAWDERQELMPMESFLREQTVKTWKNLIDRSERTSVKTYLE